MPKRLTVALRKVALHREELALLEAMRLFVPSIRLTVFGELDPFESPDRADPGSAKLMLVDEITKRFL